MVDPEAATHTAEHVFMRALTRRLDVFPVLVEQDGWDGRIVVEGDEPTWPVIADALTEANTVIMEGRTVTERVLGSIEEARAAFPALRAYEERISPPVRVIEVQGYDWAACARRHVRNTLESWGIAVRDVRSLSGGRHELKFSAGPAAAAAYSTALREAGLSARALNVKLDELSARVNDTLDRLERSRAIQRSMSRALLRGPRVLKSRSGSDIRVVEAEGLDFKGLIENSVEIATASRTPVLAISTEDPAQILLACPRGSGINAGAVLKGILSALGGRGGGGPEAATGSLSAATVPELLERLQSSL